MTIQGPYIDTKAAAEFCGYSPRHFLRLVERHDIPRYGPGSNRYLVDDLHLFMDNPNAFQVARVPRRRSSGFTPVAA